MNKKLTIQAVKDAVRDVETAGRDPEKAHCIEDELYVLVLKAVAAGHPDSRKLAKEALKTKKLVFPRYCA